MSYRATAASMTALSSPIRCRRARRSGPGSQNTLLWSWKRTVSTVRAARLQRTDHRLVVRAELIRVEVGAQRVVHADQHHRHVRRHLHRRWKLLPPDARHAGAQG